MKKIDSEKNKRIRIAILEALKTEYPGSLDMKVLLFFLDNLGYPLMDDMLNAHLRYLEEKKLLRIERKKGYGFQVSFATLTAEGWDLLDGHGHEHGIDEAL
ncbi:MAG: hypothetical protein HZB62_10715 [Nitrospirae bacterium]|nr:hypothetical protein [Nitrospirota bacterium]